jgi:3-hydroxyisobutyrate dehydrogenase
MIAVLGTGLLGSGFARALAGKGETVHVWNRTPERARAIADGKISAFDSVADAVRGADRIHVTLSDDAAVDAVLAAAGLAAGALVIDHSTTSTAGAVARTQRWRDAGVTYAHAPVFMGPQQALEGTGLMLVSGDRDVVARITPLVARMTGKVIDLGDRVDAAAAFKLFGNLFLMAMTLGVADMLGLARAMGVAPETAATLFEHFKPGAAVGARAARMIEVARGKDDPSWELAMARKDARLIQAEAERGGASLILLDAIAARMDEAIARGLGRADWTVIARDLIGGKPA